MSGTHPEPTEPRIIKKKKGHHAAHGGAWKVAYADFVTAMMALFIVLWIMSQSQSIRQNVAQYFKNPGLLPGATGLLETSDMGGEMPTPGHSQELQTPAPIQPDLASRSSDKGTLEEVKKRITEIIAQLPELSRLKKQVVLEITDEGLRIELLDREGSHFFDIGSANLKSETQDLLKLIAQELEKIPNHITIEGHTDSRPYGTKQYTNWELSTDRANAARRIIEEAGVRKGQITSVRGYADQRLRNSQDPMDIQNRRVSIVVKCKKGAQAESLKIPQISGISVAPAPGVDSPGKASPSTVPTSPPAATATSAPTVPSTAPGPSPAPTQDAAPPPHSQTSGTGDTLARPPEKDKPAPSPVFKGDIPPASHRLEDRVRDEVRQLFEQEANSNSASGNSLGFLKKPHQRLGW
jgi:chemotaxis protein MotB